MRNYDLEFLKRFSLVIGFLSVLTLGLIAFAYYLNTQVVRDADPAVRAQVVVTFRRDEALEMWVPDKMEEYYKAALAVEKNSESRVEMPMSHMYSSSRAFSPWRLCGVPASVPMAMRPPAL